MADETAGPTVVKNDRKQWTNWHRNVTQKIRGLYDVYNPAGDATLDGMKATVAELQPIIADAQHRGDRLPAIGVRLADTPRVLYRILDVHARVGPAPIVLACRFVQSSKGLLAFTRFEPTCVIDMDGVHSRRSTDFFRAIWQDLDAAGVPIPSTGARPTR